MSNSPSPSVNNATTPATADSSDRVFRALREARSQLESLERSRNERVAIIGMAGRFPGADNLEEFWQLVSQGQSGIQTLSEEELRESGVDPSIFEQPDYVPAYASFSQPDGFDATFFGYSPREAEVIDPQHRVFLECAWSALEDAGYNSKTYDGSIGVYGGAALNSYLINLHSQPKVRESLDDVQVVVSNVMGLMPTRVSYKLDLTGPSCGIQTGCSTSLVTVHLACQSLLNHDCDIALAGGVTVTNATPEGYVYQPDGIASPDGRCRAFDLEGKGTVFGNGVGMVVLKRLQAAVQDGDHIYAVIKGTAINNDGAQKVGLTAPSVKGQADVIAAALNQAGVSADSIGYVETHGTGTALGDPIEIAALTQAFWKSRAHKQSEGAGRTAKSVDDAIDKSLEPHRCAIGSVKTNLGHLDAAAGIAGLIKTALSLHHKVLPPSLNFQQPNPKIDFANSPFYVQTEAEAWERNGQPRRAGVSSFGMGGTNAHAILEEAPEFESIPAPRQNTQAEGRHAHPSAPWQLIPLSARTTTALDQATDNLAAYLHQADAGSLQEVAYTLQTGRQALLQRQFCLAQSHGEAIEILADRHSSRLHRQQSPTAAPPIFFLFSGQGSQYGDMGRGLYETQPLFRDIIDRCSELLTPHLNGSLLDILYPDRQATPLQVDPTTNTPCRPGQRTQSHKLRETAYAQPALFVIEYALAKLWMSWGIQPQALMGHSLGEYTAACLAGVFSLEDALSLVAMRGKLMQQCPPGAMLSISQSETDVAALLNSDSLAADVRSQLTIAVINGPQLCAVSGPASAITELQSHLETQEIPCQRLYTSHGFHSPLMEPCLEAFAAQVAQVSLHPPELELISNVTGTWMTDAQATSPDYWVSHIRQTVRFGDGIDQLLQTPDGVYLEVGPGQTLCRLTQQIVAQQTVAHSVAAIARPKPALIVNSLPHPKDQQLDSVALLQALGKLWQAGAEVHWEALHPPEQRRRLSLPTYPFERQRYWIERRNGSEPVDLEAQALEKKANMADWFYQPSWRRSLLPFPSQTSTPPSTCLFFAGTGPISQQLGQRLAAHGQQLIWITPGEAFATTENGFTLNPNHPEDYRQLVAALEANPLEATQVVHLWDVDQAGFTPDVDQQPSHPQPSQKPELLAFHSLLSLAQAFQAQSQPQDLPKLSLYVITGGIHDVLGTEVIDPLRATVLAPCKVLPQEFSGWRCCNLDVVVPPVATAGFEQLMDALLAEILSVEVASKTETDTESAPSTIEPIVVYRDSYRWTQSLEPVALPEALESAEALPLQTGGVYLVAGDLVEGLGTLFAQWLRQTCQAKLVLIGRPGFPAPTAWEQWLLTHSPVHEISRCIRRLQALGSVGMDLLWFSADLAEEKAISAAIAQAQETFGPIQGVIHAGAMGDRESCMVNELDLATRDRTFSSKVQGLQVIETCLQGQELDFYLLQSSLSAIVGGVGFGAYAAANLYLDSLATQRRRQAQAQGEKTIWLSLNWDACQLEQTDGSASSPQPIIGSTLADSAMLPPEVQALTARALSLAHQNPSVTQLAISPTDLPTRLDKWILHPELLHQSLADVDSALTDEATAHGRPQISNAYVAPRNAVEQVVAEALAELLGIEQVGIHDNFFELGGHSLLAIQAITRLRKIFEVEIPMREFLFESPTAAGIAAMVERHQPNSEVDESSEMLETSGDDISNLLEQIEEMSPDDVSRELQI